MALNVVMVTGPRRSGKSMLAQALIDEVCEAQPHYIRLAASDGTKRPPPAQKNGNNSKSNCEVATATWVQYDAQRVFETLPTALAAVQRRDRGGCVVMEADTDPNLRNAYPYDIQVFLMPAPREVHEVFRTPTEARRALQSAMHDSGAFAGEIFGLSVEDDSSVDEAHEKRPDMSDSQIGHFMRSPLGEELASRIQCHPAYHGMLESDAIVLNTGVGGGTEAVDEVVRRLEALARRTRAMGNACPIVFCCDLADAEDPRRCKLLEHLRRRFVEQQSGAVED